MLHSERIDRLASLLVRYQDRFHRDTPAPVVDRKRVARLRLALATALKSARAGAPTLRLVPAKRDPDPRLRFGWGWLVPLNLPFKIRRRGEP